MGKMAKDKGFREKRNYRKAIIFLLVIWLGFGVVQNSGSIFAFFVEQTGADAVFHRIPASEKWNLIVVNRWNEIPEDYEVTLTELENGEKVDSRIYPDLQAMFDKMREEGLYPFVREGYRTAKEQEELLRDKVQEYRREGYFKARAERLAKSWVALPGTSEHQLGLAVDINADKERSANDEVYAWLAEHAHRYGFILRYPQGKEKVTGTAYEPWHYRYVGEEAAKEIFEQRICLEEYLLEKQD